jgi:hypothetical protein
MFSKLLIEYADPIDLADNYTLSFTIRNHSVANTWAKLLDIAIKKYSIDDPGRFYQFGTRENQIAKALQKINDTIGLINDYSPIINRRLSDVSEQDTLNYLHHIFEEYHGLLDQQDHVFWLRAPTKIRKALADLNIQVHECESIARSLSNKPSHVLTWYKMPKLVRLEDSQYNLFEDCSKLGTIYLLYTEIGKTFEDLSIDNDKYIHDDAFRPFKHFSADFQVKYYDDDPRQIEEKRVIMQQYYETNREFFEKQGLSWGHPYLRSGAIPLADLDNTSADIISELESKQWVKTITIQ